MTTMLEHQKLILAKLSHDKKLFRKEIVKSFRWLNAAEKKSLYLWLKENYEKRHPDTVREASEFFAA